METHARRVRSVAPLTTSSEVAGSPALIAGYRVLRRLNSSDRADLYVGVAATRPSSAEAEAEAEGVGVAHEQGGLTRPVVLKVFHPATDDLSVEREVRALTSLTPGRLSRLFDVGTLPDGRTCLVLEQLTGGSLSGFLEGHALIRPGQAVTILAPVAAALAELQLIGLGHGAVNLSTVLFDGGGRPVLTGLGRLQPFPDAGPERFETIDRVHSQLAQVVRAVLDQVDAARPAAASQRDLERWCAVPVHRSGARSPEELEELLFAWAESVPVPLGQVLVDAGRPESAGDWLRRRAPDGPARWGRGRAPEAATEQPGPARLPASRMSRVGTTVRRLWEAASAGKLKSLLATRSHRGPLRHAVLLAVVCTGLVLTALGPGEPLPAEKGQPETSPDPTAASGTPSADRGESTAPGSTGSDSIGSDSIGSDSEGSDSEGSDSESFAVTGDDPAVAVPVLLRIRTRCLAEVSVVCLDGVHQPQSAAMAADSYALRMMQEGGASLEHEDLAAWTAVLVEHRGAVALVSLQPPVAERQPASVLVVKGEAGWRIRDIFDY